jgi:hypothetical protein
MSSKAAFWKWALLGGAAAIVLLVAQAEAVGGTAGLLQVGETSALRPIIEEELGEIPLAPGPGHDGQIYYAIGLDLSGDELAPLLDHGAYRYRRVLYPLLASAFGLLDGEGLLGGMIILAILATAITSGAVAAAAVQMGGSEWVALAVVFNPGVWLSARLLTADNLALALMAVGLLTVASSTRKTVSAFTLSVLAKDVFLVTPAGLSLTRERRRWLLFAVPAVALVIWMSWLTLTLGDGFTGRGNLSLPFQGIIDASRNWGNLDTEELLYLGFALLSVAAGVLFTVIFRSWLRVPILAWSLLGIVSSNWVWDFGNNAARAFAPIAVLVVLGTQRQATEPTLAAERDRRTSSTS